jgi:hypothetical protein
MILFLKVLVVYVALVVIKRLLIALELWPDRFELKSIRLKDSGQVIGFGRGRTPFEQAQLVLCTVINIGLVVWAVVLFFQAVKTP